MDNVQCSPDTGRTQSGSALSIIHYTLSITRSKWFLADKFLEYFSHQYRQREVMANGVTEITGVDRLDRLTIFAVLYYFAGGNIDDVPQV